MNDGDKSTNRDQHDRSAKRRRRTMRLMAVLLGLLPLVVLEVTLRWTTTRPVREGIDQDPLVNMDQLRPLFVSSADRWTIPPERMNFFRPASFAKTRPPNSKRIFVLGGSTVQGRPYATETSFSKWLELWLRAANPDTRFEVINCGGVSYASYRVSKILDEVLRHDPDAIVLYTGHNEFLEERTYADTRSLGVVRRTATRISSHLRTVQWIQERLAKPESAKTDATRLAGEVDAILDHQGGRDRYRRDPALRAAVENHFAATFQRMITATRSADVPLIVCVPAGDLVNTPPIKTEIGPLLDEAQKSQFRSAWSIASDVSEPTGRRLKACESCLAVDPEHAGAAYIAGRIEYERDRVDAAKNHLVAARDHDVCPLRATSSIIDSVIQVAKANEVALIRTDQLFDRRDRSGRLVPDGIVDPELFVDHVHPTIAGHQQLAEVIFRRLGSMDNWTSTAPEQEIQTRYESLVQAHLATLDESYFARGKQRLAGLRRWASGRASRHGVEEKAVPDPGSSDREPDRAE